MKKVVINNSYGGFNLSDKAVKMLSELKGESIEWIQWYSLPRDDKDLVEVVEKLGYAANNLWSNLAIAEIPEDIGWEIQEYDGLETVCETHRTWGPSITFKKPKPKHNKDVDQDRQ